MGVGARSKSGTGLGVTYSQMIVKTTRVDGIVQEHMSLLGAMGPG